MGSMQEPSFTGGPEIIRCAALLFDFDGSSSVLPRTAMLHLLTSCYFRHNHRQHSCYREALGKVSNYSTLYTRSIHVLVTLLNYSFLALSLMDISSSPVDSASASKAIVVGDLNFDPLCPIFGARLS